VRLALRKPSLFTPETLAIGSSTGGPQALLNLFRTLKDTLRAPVFITQHMPPTFTSILAEHLAQTSGAACKEAEDGEPVAAGHIYVAPGDYHMLVERRADGVVTRVTRDAPENYCRPAVDPMLRSLARAYGAKVLAVILNGMGHDGLGGGRAVVEAGGTLIAQDEETSVVWGMPGAVATAGLASAVLPLDQIAPRIAQAFREPGR
jgi:two-component system chemotaxis response regulator CheB